jgi:hypothetical protein
MPGNLQNRLYILFPPPVVYLTATHFSLFFIVFIVFIVLVVTALETSILDSINGLGSIAETSCVSCEVRTGFLYLRGRHSS